MRIEATVKKNDQKSHPDFKHDSYTWIKLVPEKDYDRYTHDLMMIGRYTLLLDQAKVEYKLIIVEGNIDGLEIHECHFLKFLTKHFFHNDV